MLRLGLLVLALRPLSAAAFSHRGQPRAHLPERCDAATPPPASLSRRLFLDAAAASAALVAAPHANAVVFDASQKGGTLKNLTPEEAEERFRAGRASVAYLLRNYDVICEGGGDNVRRYLGTVGTSGLFGIQKAMKALAERAEDIVEYTELSREIEQTIEQADGSAYMAIFVTTSTSYTPPEKYFKDAKIEIERCAKTMDELAALIGLKLLVQSIPNAFRSSS